MEVESSDNLRDEMKYLPIKSQDNELSTYVLLA